MPSYTEKQKKERIELTEKFNTKAVRVMHVFGILLLYLLHIILTGSFKI